MEAEEETRDYGSVFSMKQQKDPNVLHYITCKSTTTNSRTEVGGGLRWPVEDSQRMQRKARLTFLKEFKK